MSRRNSLNFCHGTLAFSYLRLLILQWYILSFRLISDAAHSAVCSESRAGTGTSDDCTVVVAAAAASADNVGRLFADDLCSCLLCTDSLDCCVVARAFLAHATLADGLHTDAVTAVDDVSEVAARAESSDDNSVRFASLSLHDERSSFHSKSSIQFLRWSRDDL